MIKSIAAKNSSETNPVLNLKITWKYLLAFFALTIVCGELHEQIHIQTGRFICGGYGERDFNAWRTAADCTAPAWAFLATLVGPLWSFAVMWTGAFLLLRAKSVAVKTVSFSLVFASLPFARIFTAIIGGGDIKVILHAFFGNELGLTAVKILAAIIVTLICPPPILVAWRSLKNRFAAFYIIGFMILPLVVLSLYVLTFLNSVLASGFLSSAPVLGTPLLILAHFSLMAILLILCSRWLLEINSRKVTTELP